MGRRSSSKGPRDPSPRKRRAPGASRQAFPQLRRAFLTAISSSQPLDAALDLLLAATRGRAVGLWRASGDRLLLMGFRAVADMPREVAEGFRADTGDVSLAGIGYGIVQAALRKEPVPAYRQDLALRGSAGWIERFGAVQSLSAPAIHDGRVLGVLAVSVPYRFDRESEAWALIDRLARALAPALAGGPAKGKR